MVKLNPDGTKRQSLWSGLLWIVFIVFGVWLLPQGIAAMFTGEKVHTISHNASYYGWEVMLTSLGAMAFGVFGLWTLIQSRRR
jgi:hypothetical protein